MIASPHLTGQKMADEYQARFANWDEIAHPAVIMDPRFAALVNEALNHGAAVTREQVEAVFGELPWEE